ncbi:MAG: hypothetical protein P1V97_02600 [Planctomycetota bacterium]|nr:hypothetical protein [Planctomycetota bacterium]
MICEKGYENNLTCWRCIDGAYAHCVCSRCTDGKCLDQVRRKDRRRKRQAKLRSLFYLVAVVKDERDRDQTRFHFEKNIGKGLTKAGKKFLKAEEAAKATTDFVLDLKVNVKYFELKMKMDGKEAQTGHKWQGTIVGTLKDAAGTEVKKINIRHSWGTNMNVPRKKGASIFMSQLSNWLILELGTTKSFRAIIPADKHAELDKTLARYKTQKKKIYDDTWK